MMFNSLLAITDVVSVLLWAGLGFVLGGLAGWRVQVFRFNRWMNRQKEKQAALDVQAALNLDVPGPYRGKLLLFVLAGQSNMSGRGETPPKWRDTHSQIYLFGNDYRWKLASEPIDSPAGQVDKVSEDWNAGCSPGMSFARTLLEKDPSLLIGLIPCSRGGTSMYQWSRSLSDQSLYGCMIKRVGAARQMGQLAGLLWFQGEEDALDPQFHRDIQPAGGAWAQAFAEFVDAARADLNDPELPVVFGQIATNTDPDHYRHWDAVKRSQAQVRLANAAMIPSEDLALCDRVHFTPQSYIEIGRRLANAYWELTRAPSSTSVEGSERATAHA